MISSLFNIRIITVKKKKITVISYRVIIRVLLSIYILTNHKRMEANVKCCKKISSSEGAIDGISFEIQRPNTDPKNLIIRDIYIFMLFTHRLQLKVWVKYGILNMGFQVIKMIKIIPFPKECVLLANKIYPNRYQIGTPFTAQQID